MGDIPTFNRRKANTAKCSGTSETVTLDEILKAKLCHVQCSVCTRVFEISNVEEKLPLSKHLLIADEDNVCGISSKSKKNGVSETKKHAMQAPGLEAMPVPAVEHSNCNEGLPKDGCQEKGENFGDGSGNGFPTEGGLSLSLEKGNVRPQKIQKTGVSDRHSLTHSNFTKDQKWNDGLSGEVRNYDLKTQVLNTHTAGRIWSRTTSKQGRRVSAPVNSANKTKDFIALNRNMSRNRQRVPRKPDCGDNNQNVCPQTRDNSSPVKKVTVRNEMNELQSLEQMPISKMFTSQKNESPSVALKHRSQRHGKMLVGDRVPPKSRTTSTQGRRVSPPVNSVNESTPVNSVNESKDFIALNRNMSRNRQRVSSKPDDGDNKLNVCPQTRDNISPVKKETIRNEMNDSVALKHRAQRHGKMLVGDRVPPKSKMKSTQGRRVSPPVNSVNETKDFIALNRNMSRYRQRVSRKHDGGVAVEKKFYTGKNDSLATQRSPVRERRTLNVVRLVDNSCAASSSGKQRTNKINTVIASETRIRSTPKNQTCLRSEPASQRGSNNADIVSFAFNSPVRSTTAKTVDEMDSRDPTSSVISKSLHHSVKKHNRNSLRVNGDALGAILEQKLKELSHQAETEAATGFTPSARTTALILQDLISSLRAARPVSCEEESTQTDTKDSECNSDVADNVSQAKPRSKRSSNGLSREIDQFSPGCVHDASFSDDSCISSSMDDNSGQQASSTHTDLLDSASLTNKCGHGVMMVASLVNHTSTILQDVNLVHSRLTSTKLNYVLEIVLNTELLFGNVCHSSSHFLDFLLGPFLDELESHVSAAGKNSIILGIEVRKVNNPLRRFLLDCLIECLEVKYTRYSDSGFKAWSKLPKGIDAEILIKSFDEEVTKWVSFAGKSSDYIAKREMRNSLGEWTDFEIEACETGAEITEDLVQMLVDEIVTDLHSSSL